MEQSKPSRRRRRYAKWVSQLLGPQEQVLACELGRANVRWTPGATVFVVIVGIVVLLALVVAHTVVFPGGLAIVGFISMIMPFR